MENWQFLKGATSEFAHLAQFSLNFSSSSFATRVNLLHPNFILVSLWCNIISLVFSNLSEILFSGFFSVEGALFAAKIRNENKLIELL